MSDPLASVSPGQVSPLVASAASVNAVLEACRAFRAAKGAGARTRSEAAPVVPAAEVYVRNDTGGSLPEFSVVALGTPVISASTYPLRLRRSPVFPGTAPAAATDAFAITLEPAGVSGIVTAAVLGVVVCDLVVSDAAHGYAKPTAATTATLESAEAGPAKIVWKASGTGTKRAVVLLTGAIAGTAREITYVSSVCPTIEEGVVTGITVETKTVTVLATTTIADPVCTDDPDECCLTTWDCVDEICTEVAGAGGEYADLAACLAAECETPVEVVCCDGYLVPRRLTLTVSSSCPGLNGSFELVYDRPPTFGLPQWDNTVSTLNPANRWSLDTTTMFGGKETRILVECVNFGGGSFGWSVIWWTSNAPSPSAGKSFDATFASYTDPPEYTCDPLDCSKTLPADNIQSAGGLALSGCSTEDVTITLTE